MNIKTNKDFFKQIDSTIEITNLQSVDSLIQRFYSSEEYETYHYKKQNVFMVIVPYVNYEPYKKWIVDYLLYSIKLRGFAAFPMIFVKK